MIGPSADTLVLIVDDSEVARTVVSGQLTAAGYATAQVASGEACLEWLGAHGADCVLLDLTMPGLDGLATLRELRRRFTRSQLPVVMLTAHAESERVVAALGLGANDYVVKPVDAAVLAARVEAQVSRKRSEEELRAAQEELRRMVQNNTGELARTARKLEETQHQLGAALDAMSQEFALFDAKDRLVLWNAPFAAHYAAVGHTVAAGQPFETLLRLSLAQGVAAQDSAALEAEVRQRTEAHRQSLGSGEMTLGDGRTLLVTEARTHTGGTVCVRTDITEHRRAADRLADSRGRLEALVHTLPDPLFELDADGRVVDVHMPQGTRQTPADYLGRRIAELVPAGPARALESALGATLCDGQPRTVDFTLSGTQGEQHFEVRFASLGDARVLAVVRDATTAVSAHRAAEAQAHLLRQIIDTVPHWISVKNRERDYLHVNRALATDLGVAVEALRAGSVRDVAGALPPQPPRMMQMDDAVLATGRTVEEPALALTLPDGTEQVRRTVKLPLRDEAGTVQGVLTWSEDVTDRERAEAEARAHQHLLRQILDTLPHWISVKDTEGRYRLVNRAMADGHGLRVEDFQGRLTGHTRELAPGGLERMIRLDRQVLDTGEPVLQGEYTVTDLAGERRARRLAKFPLRGESGAVEGVVTWSEDVTEQRRAEAELLAGRRLLRGIIDSLPFWISVKGPDGRFQVVNRAMAEGLGLPLEEMLGRTNEVLKGTLLTPLELLNDQDRHVAATGFGVEMPQVQLVQGPDEHRLRRLAKFPLLDDNGRVEGVVSWSEDITERLQEEAMVERSRRLMAQAEEVARMGSLEWDLTTREQFWSDSVYRLLGHPPQSFPATAKAFADVLHPQDRKRVLAEMVAAAREGRGIDLECRVLHRDGRERILHARGEVTRDEQGRPQRMVGTVQDITDARKAEEEIRRSQRMEALGQLTGSVAHDFNNLLQIVNGYTHLARRRTPGDPQIGDDLREVLAAADRGSSLARQLLTFSRRGHVQRRVLVLNDLVRDLVKMLRVAVGENVALEVHLAPDTPLVEADAGMLEQVLVNLAINGRDAMASGGTLTLRTGRALDVLEAGAAAARIEIQDTGTGVPDEIRERIFDPYFSTKGSKGTGLGLATVYGIVRQHGGRIDLDTALGRGTTFTIYLPAVSPEALMAASALAAEPAPAAVPDPSEGARELGPHAPPGSRETILVAENDPQLLRMMEMLLHDGGYRLITARDGAEAVAQARSADERLALAILDIRMPGMDGLTAGRHIRELRPRLPVIYSTGDAALDGLDQVTRTPGQYLLAKPFAANELYATVRQVLDRHGAPASGKHPGAGPSSDAPPRTRHASGD